MADKYYVVLGQSNAGGIFNYGGLAEKLSVNADTAHLIPFWLGGTQIEKFLPSMDSTSLYGTFIKTVNDIGALGKIHGIIFWQGERDALHLDTTLLWMERVSFLFRTVRQDLGNIRIPIIVCLMNEHPHSKTFPYWKSLRIFGIRLITNDIYKIDTTPYEWNYDWQYPNDKVHLTIQNGYPAISQDIANLFLAHPLQP